MFAVIQRECRHSKVKVLSLTELVLLLRDGLNDIQLFTIDLSVFVLF